MKAKAAFYMLVYNTKETYLRKAIESVINQTEHNLIFFIQDNGSTDITKDILQEYDMKDSRIILFRNEINSGVTAEEHIHRSNLFQKYFIDAGVEYFAVLDSDDYYELDFLKVMYEESSASDADITVCGTNFINEEGTIVTGKRMPLNLVKICRNFTEEEFIQEYGSLRTLWGKLYSRRLWKYYWHLLDVERPIELENGIDTYVTLSLMKKVTKFISISRCLHFYRIRKSSIYRKSVKLFRIQEGEILFLKGVELAKKNEIYNEEIVNFLFQIYHNHIIDLLHVITESESMDMKEKVAGIRAILDAKLFNMLCDKNELFLCCVFNALTIIGKEVSDTDKKEMFLFINRELGNKKETKISEMLEWVDKGKYELADKNMKALMREMPLVEEILYFKLYIDINLNKWEVAHCISTMVEVFYPKSIELMGLVNIITMKEEVRS